MTTGRSAGRPGAAFGGLWTVGLVYLALALILTSPRLLGWGLHVTDDWHDNEIFFWNFWWLKEALASGSNPWYTTLVFHPEGTSLGFHPTAFLYAAVSLPFQIVLGSERGVVMAFNWITLASLTLSGLFTFCLARRLTGQVLPAFVAGLVFGFSAFHFWHLGRLHVGGIEWLPLYALALLRWLDPARRPLRDGLLLGGSAILLLYTSLTNLVAAAILTAVVLAVQLALRKVGAFDATLWRSAAAAAVVLLIAAAPFLYAWITHPAPLRASGTLAANIGWSADPAGYLLPGSTHRLYAGIAPLAAAGNAVGGREIFAGFLVLLALPSLFRRPLPGWAITWSAVALVFFVLSLGPELKLFGFETGVPLPYRALREVVPFLKVNRTPIRFAVVVQLCLALLAAGGLAALRRRPARAWLVAGAVALALVDGAHRPVLAEPRPASPVLARLASLAADTVVLNVPLYHAHVERRIMSDQIRHGRPLTTACIPRASAPQHALIQGTVLRTCLMQGSACGRADPAAVRGEIGQRGIGAIVLYTRNLTTEHRAAIEALLARAAPAERLEDPTGLVAFVF